MAEKLGEDMGTKGERREQKQRSEKSRMPKHGRSLMMIAKVITQKAKDKARE